MLLVWPFSWRQLPEYVSHSQQLDWSDFDSLKIIKEQTYSDWIRGFWARQSSLPSCCQAFYLVCLKFTITKNWFNIEACVNFPKITDHICKDAEKDIEYLVDLISTNPLKLLTCLCMQNYRRRTIPMRTKTNVSPSSASSYIFWNSLVTCTHNMSWFCRQQYKIQRLIT